MSNNLQAALQPLLDVLEKIDEAGLPAPQSPGREPSLIHHQPLIRTIQRKRRYLNIKPLAAFAFHQVTSAHHPPRRVEGSAAGVFIALARLEYGLLPNHPRPLDFIQFAASIRDHPVPAQQLHCFPTLILDGHAIGPDILRTPRR